MLSLSIQAQTPIENADAYRSFVIKNNDTIEYIVISNDLKTPKPTIIFCQGSLAIPLIIKWQDGSTFFPWANWSYAKMKEKFNLVLVSKAGIPVVVNQNELNAQYCYITDPEDQNSFPQKYLDNDNLYKYVERYNAVIKHLLKQKWVDKRHLVIVGHSQGAYVALQTTKENRKRISAIGFFSGDINGRYSQFIRSELNAAQAGLQSEEEAQAKIDDLYAQMRELCRNQTSEDKNFNIERPQKNFSRSFIETITNLPTPVYITYGTQDIVAAGCVYLPIYFELEGKTNYKVVPHINQGHNFEEIVDGKSDFSKMHWDEAMDGFLEWLTELKP